MKSIYEHIQALDKTDWDYYTLRDKQTDQNKLSIITNWDSGQENYEFIKSYLTIAGKIDVIEKFRSDKVSFKRISHSNSVFFLGCILYKLLKLQNKIKFYRNDTINEFYFIWFLTSLMHDIGYQIEECGNSLTDIKNITDDIETFKTFFGIKKDLLKTKYPLENNSRILLDMVPAYYKARKKGIFGRDRTHKIDHGIAAGLLLYNGLVINRRYLKHLNDCKQKNKEETDGLYWGKELEKFYTIASTAISIHNMRRGHDNDKEIYIENDLEKLILNGEDGHIKKLSFEKDAFAMLFALADTLEPLKLYDNCFSKNEILGNIHLCANEHTIIFENKNPKMNFDMFIDSIKKLEQWMEIKVETCVTDKRTILILSF